VANQAIVCMNVLCPLFKKKQWNRGFIDDGENAPWDNYPCPKCGGKTEPYWIIPYHYQIPGVKELEDKLLAVDAQIKALKRGRDGH